jgi:hypothetical protein
MAANDDRLAHLVQNLSQELFDQILDFTLFCSPAKVTSAVIVDDKYRPPSFLQVDSASRKILARLYYTNAVFSFARLRALWKWANSLPSEHSRCIKTLHYDFRSASRSADTIVDWASAPRRCAEALCTMPEKFDGVLTVWLGAPFGDQCHCFSIMTSTEVRWMYTMGVTWERFEVSIN